MQVVYQRYAGLDVHKQSVVACLLITGDDGRVQEQVRTFGTMTADLAALSRWLEEQRVEQVALESTGVFWWPVFNLLEEAGLAVVLVNPQHVKAVPGRKTDVADSKWLADLLRHGLLRASFIPPAAIRDLRELTRYRKALIQERTQEANRLQKVLESANIKLAAVATDILGVSGRHMLLALAAGETDPTLLADLARGQLRKKLAVLEQALCGRVKPHHRVLIRAILRHVYALEQSIEELDREVELLLAPFAQEFELLQGIPGVSRTAAATIIAEIGVEMGRFPSAQHLASWAGVVRCITRLNIPGAARKNSKGCSWVNGLPRVERQQGL
jgi:transposase